MTRDTSVYLDAVRFAAALAVLLSHAEDGWAPGLLPGVSHLGLAAVAVFFVLSGFVIGYAVDTKERDAASYAINRAARLYSVVVPCLVLTVALDTLGRHLGLAAYRLDWTRQWGAAREPLDAAASLLFVNEVWGWGLLPGSNVPFWSLGYEAPYYLVFGFAAFLPGAWGLAAGGLALLAAGPGIAALFPLWLLGWGTYRACQRAVLPRQAARALWCAAAALWLGSEALRWHYHLGWDGPIRRGWPVLWHFYAVGVPFAVSILAVRHAAVSLAVVAGAVRWCAGATFTLYLLHYPVGFFLNAVVPTWWPAWGRWVAIVPTTLVIAFAFAHVSERRKAAWRRAIVGAVAWLNFRPRTPASLGMP